MKNENDIREQTEGLSGREILDYVAGLFDGKIAFATSFGAEDQVLTDMLWRLGRKIRIFTLDTGRLPQETYDVMEAVKEKYNLDIKVYFPDALRVETMVGQKGPNLFYRSVENRKSCCQVRKVEPLRRALTGLEAWICGLRREQAVTRQNIETVAWDEQFELFKICPLALWSQQDVWNYIQQNNVPYHPLHDKGYPSIGCAPCTRAIGPDEDIRAGRWWWEEPEHKECGLHWNK
ncbi:MAG: phosphoadenylyl-sulfate reductase [Planctomycetes bacterium]|nr:phosphoadenylyl-sulfate reductase [Planctomycetota bacterium]